MSSQRSTGGMTQRSLDLYAEELAKQERSLNRREAAITEREGRAEHLRDRVRVAQAAADEASSEAARLRRQMAQPPVPPQPIVPCTHEGELNRLRAEVASERRRIQESETVLTSLLRQVETFLPRDTSGRWGNVWTRRWQDVDDEVDALLAVADIEEDDDHRLRVVVAGLMLLYGTMGTRAALRRAKTLGDLLTLATTGPDQQSKVVHPGYPPRKGSGYGLRRLG